MRQVKTKRGRILDMGALAAKYEKERAISNVPVNARGDIIDNRGNVKVPQDKILNEYYKNNVPGQTKEVPIKEDESIVEKVETQTPPPAPAPEPEPEPKPEPKPEPVVEEGVTEIGRRQRAREDGTTYWEIEYSDGSMEIEENE